MNKAHHLSVYAKPNSRYNKIEQWISVKNKYWLQVRVTAKAQSGAANHAIICLLAQTLGIAKSHICLLHGATARYKIFKITGWSDSVAEKLPPPAPQLILTLS
ncbi:DUF167 domain-containing protein [Candidatus Cardinium hertigii]|uniref:UPF0235 protein DK880_00394 n=1 Tax=Candidatus Cardinium hertigii TaxID=247481 RepID=A0A2Z3LC19_9BACT|nr:DUF167 domain-containing protein [Candidatus Cardinium hertigii]AWN81722.1 hypothetical protein DK880_00394 [Candidatus Cardinium hertigii]